MSSPAVAGPNDPALCAVNNIGVPGLGNRPDDWFFPTSGAPPAATPDDPKWKGSAGHSLTNGGATAPAELRVNWQPNAGTGQPEYVYLSWEFFVATTTAWTTDHILYLGFKNGSSTRVVRLGFRTSADQTARTQYCDTPNSGCAAAYFYTHYNGAPAAATCGSGAATGERIGRADDATKILPWVEETARFWRTTWNNDVDRWVVQLRIPVVAAGQPLSAGISEGTEIAYQSDLERASSTIEFSRWPRKSGSTGVAADRMFCKSGGATTNAVTVEDSSVFRPLSFTGGGGPAPAGGCSGTVKLQMQNIGVLDTAGNIGYQFNTTGTTKLVARVEANSSSPAVPAGQMFARFRLANWGTQDPAGFEDVPIGGPPPPTGSLSESPSTTQLNAGGSTDITLDWDLTNDQQCQYTWELRAQQSWKNQCQTCDFPGGGPDDGARAIGSAACLVGKWLHQCVAVDLRGGNVDYENRSMFNNLNFAGLSVADTVALVDTRGLQPAPGQKEWEIYFIVMPRNMPGAMAAKSMPDLIAEAAKKLLDREGPLPQCEQCDENGEYGGLTYGEVERRRILERLARLRTNGEVKMEDMSLAIYSGLDSRSAAHLVPSLEVYAFFKLYNPQASEDTLLPLTSFTLATHHDGAFNGYAYALDGATKLGGNVYKARVPINGVKRLQVEVEAVEGSAPTIGQDDDWPCGCVCGGKTCSEAYQMGNFGLAALVLAWVTRRRRPRKAAGRL